jgi:hypothetical protein
MDVDVDPDEVEERARPHRPAGAVRQRRVERIGRHAGLVEHSDAVVEQGDQHAVDHEPGRVVARNRGLAEPLDDGDRGADRVVRRQLRPDDLDERHQRSGIEEVQADDALGRGRRGSDLRHGERGRVRREDGVGAARPLEVPEQLALCTELLDDRLDHEVAVRERGELGGRLQPADGSVALLLRALAFLDLSREEVIDPGRCRLSELGRNLAPDDVEARLDRNLSDARAHRAEPDHPDPLHIHGGGIYRAPPTWSAAARRAQPR